MAILVNRDGCATAFVNLHPPVVAVGRKCEHIRERSRQHNAAQHSDQKQAHHFSIHETPFCFLLKIDCSTILFMARAVDFAMPLASCRLFSLSGEFIPTLSLSSLRNSPSS